MLMVVVVVVVVVVGGGGGGGGGGGEEGRTNAFLPHAASCLHAVNTRQLLTVEPLQSGTLGTT